MDFSHATAFAKNLFFPIFCAGCGAEGCFLCPGCAANITPRSPPWPTVGNWDFLKKMYAPFVYEEKETLAKLIQLFKYQFAGEVHESLGKLMTPFLLEHQEVFTGAAFVPIPLHKKRQQWRSFNQAEMLAKDFGQVLNIPVYPMLKRTRNTAPQAELSREQRLQNVVDAFEIDMLPPRMPKRIFLVDDVTSTGTTLQECAKTLRKYFICEVNAIVLAAP